MHRVDVLPHLGHTGPQPVEHLGGVAVREEQRAGFVVLAERPRAPAASPAPPRSTPASSRRTPTGASPAVDRSTPAAWSRKSPTGHERVHVVAVVLVHHLAHVVDARLDVRLQLRVVERGQVHVERAMAGDRRRLQLVVPATHRVAPDALLEGLRGDAGAAAELGADPLGVLGPVRTGQVERLRLVVGEPVDARHREAVEQHAVAAERLLEPAVEPGRVRVLQQSRSAPPGCGRCPAARALAPAASSPVWNSLRSPPRRRTAPPGSPSLNVG